MCAFDDHLNVYYLCSVGCCNIDRGMILAQILSGLAYQSVIDENRHSCAVH